MNALVLEGYEGLCLGVFMSVTKITTWLCHVHPSLCIYQLSSRWMDFWCILVMEISMKNLLRKFSLVKFEQKCQALYMKKT
jgi:hypothetical protein